MKKYSELTKKEREEYGYPEPPTGNLIRPIQQFLDWYYENVDYPILTEELVAYPEKGYAGTLDGVALMKTKGWVLIDFKFASHISEDYYLQTAGYSACFEPYGINLDDRIIIRLPKTLEKEEWNIKEFKYEMVENNIEVETVKTDYEMDRDTFFNCLPVKQWINKMKELKKEKENKNIHKNCGGEIRENKIKFYGDEFGEKHPALFCNKCKIEIVKKSQIEGGEKYDF